MLARQRSVLGQSFLAYAAPPPIHFQNIRPPPDRTRTPLAPNGDPRTPARLSRATYTRNVLIASSVRPRAQAPIAVATGTFNTSSYAEIPSHRQSVILAPSPRWTSSLHRPAPPPRAPHAHSLPTRYPKARRPAARWIRCHLRPWMHSAPSEGPRLRRRRTRGCCCT